MNGDEQLEISYLEIYKEKGATANILGYDVTPSIKVNGIVNEKMLGEYKINYTLDYFLYHKLKTRTIKVVDQDTPYIELVGETKVSVCPGKNYMEEGFKAVDNYDGDLTDKVVLSKKRNKVIYEVEDSSKNQYKVERDIIYIDEENPKLTLSGQKNYDIYLNEIYNEPGYTALDNCDGDITDKVLVSGSVDSKKVGTYTIIYTVKDEYGNESSEDRVINVLDKKESNNKGVIYLTFDDGPNEKTTSEILDILKEEGVKATFFVTNNGPDYDEGHTVALHTASHSYKKIYSSVDGYFEDLKVVQDRVKRITGKDVKIVRFPGGSSNTISHRYNKGIMTSLTDELLKRGYKYYDWNISSGDAGSTSKSKTVYRNVTKNLSKNRVNMILMHDTKYATKNALRNIIKYGKENGYTFEAITMDTKMLTHKINN